MKGALLNPTMARLQEAICAARIYQTKHLLESGVNVNFVDEEGLSPLMRAARISDEKSRTRHSLLKLLLQYGANVNTVDQQGRPVLSWACIHEKEDIVRLLCSATVQDIDFNPKDCDGNTPLMHAARSGNTAIVKLLLNELTKFQVDIDVRNREDRTPYMEAKRLGNEQCAEILLKEGKASTNIQVNPFLDFMNLKDEVSWEGGIRSVGFSKHAVQSGEQREYMSPDYAQKKTVKKKTRHLSHKRSVGTQQERQGLVAKAPAPRKSSASNFAKEKQMKSNERPVRMRKHAWSEMDMTPRISRNDSIAKECTTDTSNVQGIPAHTSRSKSASNHEEGTKNSKLEAGQFRRGSFTQSGRRESLKITAKLNPGLKPEGRKPYNHFRSQSCSTLTSELPVDDDVSWYSHFSVYNSPSVAFLNKLMTIYAEQASPTSSFRSGINSVTQASNPPLPNPASPNPPKIFVAETADDERSDGGRSSSGSLRLGSAASNRSISPSRKFSIASRTVVSLLSSKRALASLKA